MNAQGIQVGQTFKVVSQPSGSGWVVGERVTVYDVDVKNNRVAARTSSGGFGSIPVSCLTR